MTTHESGSGSLRRKALLCTALVLLCAALALCWLAGRRHDQGLLPREPEVPMTEEELDLQFPLLALTRADRDTEGSYPQDLDLSAFGTECLITEGGTYRLSGSLKGVLRIAAEEQTVHLLLDNISITASEGPALLAESKGKLILTLPAGTRSTISDSGHYPNGSDTESCIFSKGDLTINGSGTLVVNGLYKDAIHSKNIVRIPEGEIIIKCKRTGIHGSDGIYVCGGNLNISSQKNSLRTTKSGVDGRGNLVIAGGDHQLISGRHAFLTSRGDLYIYNCRIFDNSIVSTYNIGGKRVVQSGCIQ